MRSGLIGLSVAMALGLVACGSGASEDMQAEVVENYADLVHESYQISLDSATTMDEAIDAFVADPNADTLAAAQDAWLTARDDYGPTEAFRFYGGPIDNEENGVEGLIERMATRRGVHRLRRWLARRRCDQSARRVPHNRRRPVGVSQ